MAVPPPPALSMMKFAAVVAGEHRRPVSADLQTGIFADPHRAAGLEQEAEPCRGVVGAQRGAEQAFLLDEINSPIDKAAAPRLSIAPGDSSRSRRWSSWCRHCPNRPTNRCRHGAVETALA